MWTSPGMSLQVELHAGSGRRLSWRRVAFSVMAGEQRHRYRREASWRRSRDGRTQPHAQGLLEPPEAERGRKEPPVQPAEDLRAPSGSHSHSWISDVSR